MGSGWRINEGAGIGTEEIAFTALLASGLEGASRGAEFLGIEPIGLVGGDFLVCKEAAAEEKLRAPGRANVNRRVNVKGFEFGVAPGVGGCEFRGMDERIWIKGCCRHKGNEKVEAGGSNNYFQKSRRWLERECNFRTGFFRSEFRKVDSFETGFFQQSDAKFSGLS